MSSREHNPIAYDRWGRRASFFSLLMLQVTVGTASAFATNVYVYTVLRFLVGLTFPALYQIPFIVCLSTSRFFARKRTFAGMEMMGPGKRIFSGLLICVFFGVAMLLMGLVAAALRDWVYITIVSNTPFALLGVYWLYVH